MKKIYLFLFISLLAITSATHVFGQTELITNGDFETGDLTGWTISFSGGANGWQINDGSIAFPAVGIPSSPIGGSYDVVSTQGGAGLNLMSEMVDIPSLSFSLVLSWEDRIFNNAIDFSDPNQEFRVNILDDAMNLIATVYSTNPGDPNPQTGPNARSFNLTPLLPTIAGTSVYVQFDEQDNSGEFNVFVDNVSLMVEACPENIVVDNDSETCGAVVNYVVPAPAGVTVSQTDASGLTSGDEFPLGETIQEYEFDFGGGIIETCSFSVTVNDTLAPSVSCPEDIFVSADPGENGALIDIPLYNSEMPDDVNVLLVYADLNSNAIDVQTKLMATGKFTAVGLRNASGTVPNISELDGYKAVLVWRNGPFPDAAGLGDVLVDYINGGGGVVVGALATTTGSYPAGTFATDEYQVIVPGTRIWDTPATLGTIPLPDHLLMDGISSFDGGIQSYRASTTLTTGSYAVANWSDGRALIAAKENVGTAGARRVDINMFPPSMDVDANSWDPTTNGDLIIANSLLWAANPPPEDALVVNDLCGSVTTSNDFNAETTPSGFYPIGTTVVNIQVTDESGNISTCSFTVTVADEEPPVVIANSIEVVLDENGEYRLTQEDLKNMAEGTTDNSTPFDDLMLSAFPRHFVCANVGETIHTRLTVEDTDGNLAREWTTITVLDETPPIAVCMDLEVFLDINGQAVISPDQINSAESFDACGIESLALDEDTFDCADIGENMVTLTLTDPSGNISTCTAIVTVRDTLAPVFVPVNNIVVEVEESVEQILIDYPEILVNDNCSPEPELFEGLGQNGEFPLGITTETWIVTDAGGNSDTISFTVTVISADNTPPFLVNPIADQTIVIPDVLYISISPVLGEIFDDADGDELTISAMLEGGYPLPEWVNIINDSLVFTSAIAETGCVSIVVQAADLSGAVASDTILVCVEDLSVGSPLFNAPEMKVAMYPNPTRDQVTLEISNSMAASAEVSVFSITGKQVFLRNFNETTNITFSMKEQVSGIYFVKLNLEGKVFVKKLILGKE